MIIEIATLVLQTIGLTAGLFSEAQNRKGGKEAESLVITLQQLDVSKAIALVGPIELAEGMTGNMDAKFADEVLSDIGVREICREILLATIVDDRAFEIDLLQVALANTAANLLADRVADSDAMAFGAALADSLSAVAIKILEQAQDANPEAVIAVQHLGLLKRITAILDNVEKQSQAIERARDKVTRDSQTRFLAEYRHMAAEAHGVIQPPDFETNQKIPIGQLYVVPTIYGTSNSGLEDSEQFDFAEFASNIDRTVLLGDPGGGKSTLSSYLATTFARSTTEPVPFLVTLRSYAKHPGDLSVLQYIEQTMPAKYQVTPVSGAIEDLFLSGEALVIFDGLDELIDTTKRRLITSTVELFSLRYPLTRILVTSRRVGYEQARLDPVVFRTSQIGGFDDDDVAEYVQKWFASQRAYSSDEARRQASSFISQSQSVPDLRRNPLMLALMCIIFRGENFIPRRRPAIYEKCANLLFEKWDGHREIEVPLQARDHVDSALKYVAFTFLETGAGDSGIPNSKLVTVMTDYLYPRAMETRELAELAATEFVDFCRGRAWVFTDAGTTAEGEAIYTFTHRTFMEYFAAVHLVRISKSPEGLANTLLPRIAREEWDVVAQLAVQQADKLADQGSERALQIMLDDQRRRSSKNRAHVLKFIARCSKFAVLSPAFVRRVNEVCLAHYFKAEDTNLLGIDGTMSPWLELMDSVMDEHTATSVSAQRQILLHALDSSEDRERFLATYLLIWVLVRNSRRLVSERFDRDDPWSEMFLEIATQRPAMVIEFTDAAPGAWTAVMFAGLCTPEEAVHEMKRAGLGFGAIWFQISSVRSMHVPGQSLARAITNWFNVDQARNSLTRDAVALKISRLFLEEFWSGEPRRLNSFGNGVSARRHTLGILNASIRHPHFKDSPQELRDAAVLATLGLLEQIDQRFLTFPNGGHFRKAERRASWPAEVFDAVGASEKVSSFVQEWIRGEADVFHDTGEVSA